VTRKATRLLLIVAVALLLLIAATALVVSLYRDSIALGVARSAVGDSGIDVLDVSVGSISSSEVLFDEIVLQLAGGGILYVEGITLPVRFRGLRDGSLHVESVTYEPGKEDTGPAPLAAGLQAFLDAPGATPGATIDVDRVILPGMPLVTALAWHADPLNPTLRATVGDFEIFVTTTALGDEGHRGSIRALLPDDSEALRAALHVLPDGTGLRVEGTFGVMLEPFLPALQAIGAVPAEVIALDAVVDGTLGFRLDAEATRPVGLQAAFGAAPGAALTYDADGSPLRVSVIESTEVDAGLEYPSFDWSARTAQLSLSIGGPDFDLPPVHLRDSECRSGIRCRSALEVTFEKLAFGALTVDSIRASSAGAEFVSNEDRWEASAPATRVTLTQPAIGGRHVIAPAVRVDFAATNDRLSAAARFDTPEGGLSAAATLSHDLARGRGELSLDAATIDFARLQLSGLFIDWPYDWDVEAGQVAAAAGLGWQQTDAGFAVTGTVTASADALAGRYADIGFVGFSSRIDAEFGPQAAVTLKPARFDVELVDVGFPVEDISGIATPDIGDSAIAVSDLSMRLLGGTVTAEPFRFELDADSNQLTLRASGIQLPLMAGLADLEAVTISGSVSGAIPVTLRGNKVIIEGGHLENDPPGGVIRYRGAAAAGVVDDASQLGVVSRTLRNFEFDSLTSAVQYSEDGDLVLRMRLKGTNPDVDPTQPVILNLSVENNVPQMLRSLQATRSIEDVLEGRLSK
jgi:hypothetical protein